ncbi:MAG: flagellar export chaperone FliS [Chromatiales bacterium]|nr:flagellar export chaperone FliS [Chromatiales bacterium]
MTQSNTRGFISQYNQVAVQTDLAYASPHRLIQMLMEGALEKISVAKGLMQRGEISEKGRTISWAISIIDGLRMSLDLETGGVIAQNLSNLYDYMTRRLVEANSRNDPALLDEVSALLVEIKAAWDGIPDEVKQEHSLNGNG